MLEVVGFGHHSGLELNRVRDRDSRSSIRETRGSERANPTLHKVEIGSKFSFVEEE